MTSVSGLHDSPRLTVAGPEGGARWDRWSEPGVYAGILAVGVVSWVLLHTTNAFYSNVLVSVLAWTVATTGLNIIAGLGGYPSLVQAAFYGIGAYVSTILVSDGHGFWVAATASVLTASAAGLAVGVFFTRTRGQYFAIGTLFFGAVFTLVLDNWSGRTGGPNGLPVPLAVASIDRVYLLLAGAVVVSMSLFRFLSGRRFGRRLMSIREDEDLAEHLGVPTTLVKLLAFVVSAGVGGAAGVVFAQYNGSVSPGLFTYYVGFLMFVALGVGGSGRLFGPLLGNLFVEGFPQMLKLSNGFGQLIVGLVFVIVMITVPSGFMGLLDSPGRWLSARMSRDRA